MATSKKIREKGRAFHNVRIRLGFPVLSCGAREVRCPCAWRGGACHCSRVMVGVPGFSVHRIFQARVPEWVAISFSRGSSWDRTQVSRIASRRFTIWASFIREAHEKKSQLKQQTSMLSYFKKLSDLSFSNHHPNQSTDITLKQDPLSAKTLWLTEASDDVYYFSAQNFFFFSFFDSVVQHAES